MCELKQTPNLQEKKKSHTSENAENMEGSYARWMSACNGTTAVMSESLLLHPTSVTALRVSLDSHKDVVIAKVFLCPKKKVWRFVGSELT